MCVCFEHKIIWFSKIVKTIIFVEYLIYYIWKRFEISKICVRKLWLIINSLEKENLNLRSQFRSRNHSDRRTWKDKVFCQIIVIT